MSSRYIDITLKVISKIKYQDGHYENGPSTKIAYRVTTPEAARNAVDTIDKTIDELYKETFGDRIRKGFREFLVGTEEEQAETPIDITYYIHERSVGSNGQVLSDEKYEVIKAAP